MTTLTVLDPARSETIDARRTTRSRRHDLPPDLLREASSRLGIVALVSGLLWMLGSAIAHIVGITPTHQHRQQPDSALRRRFEDLRDLMISKGAKWPPDPPDKVRAWRKAQGLRVAE
jgi:hypothetical protein